jgi:hypothetical protein
MLVYTLGQELARSLEAIDGVGSLDWVPINRGTEMLVRGQVTSQVNSGAHEGPSKILRGKVRGDCLSAVLANRFLDAFRLIWVNHPRES